MIRLAGIVAWILVAGAAPPVPAQCPSEAVMRARLAQADMRSASRTASFGRPVPTDLYGEAIGEVGHAFARRDGIKVNGVIVAPLPAADIWRAINDEPHHADGYLPVKASWVVEGVPRGPERVIFQYYKKAGIGRWWASRVRINAELYRATEGRVWEMSWVDWMDRVDRTRPPILEVAEDVRPIVESRGSWALVPLAERCVLVEHFNWSDPGGALGVLQALLAKGAIRDTLTGIVRMAEEHHCAPPKEAPFHGPDGKPLDR